MPSVVRNTWSRPSIETRTSVSMAVLPATSENVPASRKADRSSLSLISARAMSSAPADAGS